MTQPNRSTTAGRVYLDLQAQARREHRPTDELLVFYVLERFLYRLSRSPHRDRLVLKGGMLLAAFHERRPTGDVGLLARATPNNVDSIAQLVREVIAATDVDDGVVYELEQLHSQVIREGETYAGVRVVVPARVARANHPLRVDINVGDPITPKPIELDYPALLGSSFRVVSYPLVSVLAEKIVTMIDRGDATTRERDFADVLLITTRHNIDAGQLSSAISATAAHRGSDIQPLTQILIDLAAERQNYLQRSGLTPTLPSIYEQAIADVARFADPVLAGSVQSGRWDSSGRTWITGQSQDT